MELSHGKSIPSFNFCLKLKFVFVSQRLNPVITRFFEENLCLFAYVLYVLSVRAVLYRCVRAAV